MRIIIAILLVLGVLTWDLISDISKWRQGVPVSHTIEAVVRMALLIPAALLLSLKQNKVWLVFAVSVFMIGSFYWLFFDGLYNSFRGFGFWFNGSVDPDDSFLDRILMKMKDWQEALLKIGLFASSVLLYIFVRNKTKII